MTGLSAETQLLLVAALFYFYETAVLLYVNEALITPAPRGRWTFVFQPNSVSFRGRALFIPNLCLPHRPVFRLAWSAEFLSLNDTEDWCAKRARYARFVPLVYGSAISLFILLPASLFLLRADVFVLSAALLIYLHSVIAAVMVVRGHAAFGLQKARAWAIAFEYVLCPPLTINVVRRLSLAEQIAASIPAAGLRLLEREGWESLKAKLLLQQEHEIEDAPSADVRDALEQARRELSAATKPS